MVTMQDTLDRMANLSDAILVLSEHGVLVITRESDGRCEIDGKVVSEEAVIEAAGLLNRKGSQATL